MADKGRAQAVLAMMDKHAATADEGGKPEELTENAFEEPSEEHEGIAKDLHAAQNVGDHKAMAAALMAMHRLMMAGHSPSESDSKE